MTLLLSIGVINLVRSLKEKQSRHIGVGSYPLTLVLDEQSRIVLLESGTTPVQRARILRAISE